MMEVSGIDRRVLDYVKHDISNMNMSDAIEQLYVIEAVMCQDDLSEMDIIVLRRSLGRIRQYLQHKNEKRDMLKEGINTLRKHIKDTYSEEN